MMVLSKKILTLVIFFYLVVLFTAKTRVLVKSCGCMPSLCCNTRGSCGVGNKYCGRGCKEGPCYIESRKNRVLVVTDIVTDVFFNRFEEHMDGSCIEKGLYTLDSFYNVIVSYPKFGTVGTTDNSKREIAAFFAHFTHDATDMCERVHIHGNTWACDRKNTKYECNPGGGQDWKNVPQVSTEQNSLNPDSCDKSNTEYPCNPGGGNDWSSVPQVSTEHNSDGLKTGHPVVSFNTTLKFWMKNCHDSIVSGRGFGATIRAINGKFECDGANPGSVTARVQYFKDYCNHLQVDPGTKLRC